jgi:hypothetical protein
MSIIVAKKQIIKPTRRFFITGALATLCAPAIIKPVEAKYAANPVSLFSIIQLLGLTTNLEMCLDTRVGASYTSGLRWVDLTANGYNFFKGTDGTTAAPTFVGTAGMPSAYFSLDGTQYFTYDSANETWMTAMHQNNALFSWVIISYHGTAFGMLLGDNGTSTTAGTGLNLALNATEQLALRVRNAGAAVCTYTSTATVGENTLSFVGLSVNEAAGASGGNALINGTAETFDATYSSPSAGAATQTLQLGAVGGGALIAPNGNRFVAAAAWSRALTAAQLLSLRQMIRQPIGL